MASWSCSMVTAPGSWHPSVGRGHYAGPLWHRVGCPDVKPVASPHTLAAQLLRMPGIPAASQHATHCHACHTAPGAAWHWARHAMRRQRCRVSAGQWSRTRVWQPCTCQLCHRGAWLHSRDTVSGIGPAGAQQCCPGARVPVQAACAGAGSTALPPAHANHTNCHPG